MLGTRLFSIHTIYNEKTYIFTNDNIGLGQPQISLYIKFDGLQMYTNYY